MKSLFRAAFAALLLSAGTAGAQDPEQEFLDSLQYRDGLVTLPDAQASLTLNDRFRFLGQEDARAVLEDYWGNPEDPSVLGLLVPKAEPLGTEHSWVVVLTYSDEGYVSDEDAAEIDYDELLADMQEATLAQNEELADMGYPTSQLVGWAKPPHYDTVNKRLHWAQHIQFEGNDGGTLNYDIRVLGRKGYLSMLAVSDIGDLPRVDAAMGDVLRMAKFDAAPCFQQDGVAMRELQLEAFKPAADHDRCEVLYKGPFREVTDDAGHVYERGRRVHVPVSAAELLRRGPLAELFLFLDNVPVAAHACSD